MRGSAIILRDRSGIPQAELASSQLAAIVESSDDEIIGKTLDGRITSRNAGAQELFGDNAHETIGNFVQTLIPVDRQDEEMRILANLARGIRVPAFETIRRRKDGRRIGVSLTISPIRDAEGRIAGASKMVHDASIRKKAEQAAAAAAALEKQERFIRTITDAIPSMIAYWDEDLRCRFANAAYIEWFGREPGAMLGTTLQALPDEELFSTNEPYIRGALRGDRQQFERALVKQDGSIDYTWTKYIPDVVDRRVHGFCALASDVIPLKLTELRLDALNEELTRRVAAAKTANIALRTANDELDSFAHAVSHDLRAPLRAMSGFTRLLQEDYCDSLDDGARRLLGEIDIASQKMEALIDGILTLARSTRGTIELEDIDVTAISTRVLNGLALTEPTRVTESHVEPGLHIVGDPRMIESVMYNQIGNAWKYSPKAPAPVMRVYRGSIDRLSGICVTDNGAGFDNSHVKLLFKPFQRLHRQ